MSRRMPTPTSGPSEPLVRGSMLPLGPLVPSRGSRRDGWAKADPDGRGVPLATGGPDGSGASCETPAGVGSNWTQP